MDALEQQQQQQLPGAGTLSENQEVAAGRDARILTWNINGLRKVAADHGGVKQLLDQFNADIGANLSPLLLYCCATATCSEVRCYCCSFPLHSKMLSNALRCSSRLFHKAGQQLLVSKTYLGEKVFRSSGVGDELSAV